MMPNMFYPDKTHSKSGTRINPPRKQSVITPWAMPRTATKPHHRPRYTLEAVVKRRRFETAFTFIMNILNKCLVLIPDSEDTRAIKQQNQQQQAQLSAIKHTMGELIARYISG